MGRLTVCCCFQIFLCVPALCDVTFNNKYYVLSFSMYKAMEHQLGLLGVSVSSCIMALFGYRAVLVARQAVFCDSSTKCLSLVSSCNADILCWFTCDEPSGVF